MEPGAFDLIERLVWHHDGPFGDSSAVPTSIVSKLTRQQVTVVLTGDGGDELFAGYWRFYAALLAERTPAPLRRLAGSCGKSVCRLARTRAAWLSRRQAFCGGGQPAVRRAHHAVVGPVL